MYDAQDDVHGGGEDEGGEGCDVNENDDYDDDDDDDKLVKGREDSALSVLEDSD